MNADKYQTYDAAYVLGALSAADKHAFELHLGSCDACAERVAEAAAATSLLALAPSSALQMPGTDANAPWAQEPLPDTLLPRLLQLVPRKRPTRRSVWAAGTAAAAACLVLVSALVIPRHGPASSSPPQAATTMSNVGTAPIKASVQVVTHDSWAQVNVWFTYQAHTFTEGNYQAVARNKDGRSEIIGTWPGIPGQTAVVRTPTHFHTDELASIDIVNAQGTVVSRSPI